MTPEIKQNEDSWQETNSAFHAYLQNTVELLEHKQEITKIDAPVPPNPRKAISRKPVQVILDVKISNPDPILPVDKERVVSKPSGRAYSSPLWVGLGDENLGRSNSKTKHNSKTK